MAMAAAGVEGREEKKGAAAGALELARAPAC